ncbi:hypothetical protein H1191_12750 [Paenactinomyces guangxiensis]|uniref:Condensation domain-containing protein n=1 Tax=Paenactinomyces guangxiensis TaxID=1490290 RepID=A0A7W1WSB4_9BACL|nr:hypothetical protein [Paenactinomyces guangxiensis]MBH8592141.1 hypothetical protein [Paenactinomyces guangxiensis]
MFHCIPLFLDQAPSPLSQLPVQYTDYTQWQREYLQGEVWDRQLSFWKRLFTNELPVLQLPADRPRPTRSVFKGDIVTLKFKNYWTN